ncbi:hypothetical protein M427DRAFT_54032 [Gonapodya prolifera JEL478]|uniref:SMP-LTD domain-containing protein n=1 Tax=Gonapodya prolifera (strain JEL478) TaxID=1344416 RepID=A0A139AN86_GONPJ|nr:hypothetical protein M427DRAFT_54032 [Gonapodya prolifera JEL478]|eukprot:KXS18206.1 hypothetical protein M427DRAFT_54032 [Gonapodya prolifera JEL478]
MGSDAEAMEDSEGGTAMVENERLELPDAVTVELTRQAEAAARAVATSSNEPHTDTPISTQGDHSATAATAKQPPAQTVMVTVKVVHQHEYLPYSHNPYYNYPRAHSDEATSNPAPRNQYPLGNPQNPAPGYPAWNLPPDWERPLQYPDSPSYGVPPSGEAPVAPIPASPPSLPVSSRQNTGASTDGSPSETQLDTTPSSTDPAHPHVATPTTVQFGEGSVGTTGPGVLVPLQGSVASRVALSSILRRTLTPPPFFSFILGILLGQAVLLFLLMCIARAAFFRGNVETERVMKAGKGKGGKGEKHSRVRVKPTPPLPPAALIARLLPSTPGQPPPPDVLTHLASVTPESCTWVNLLLAQLVSRCRQDRVFAEGIVEVVGEMSNARRPGWLGPITITDFSMGDEFPSVKVARVRPARGGASVRVELELSLHDNISLGLDTFVVVNWPKPLIASLPVGITVSVVKFEGKIALEFVTETVPIAPPRAPAAPHTNGDVPPGTGAGATEGTAPPAAPSAPPPTSPVDLPDAADDFFSSTTSALLSNILPGTIVVDGTAGVASTPPAAAVGGGSTGSGTGATPAMGTDVPATTTEISLRVCLLPDFQLDLDVRSMVGHRTKVKDLPRLTSMISAWIKERLVGPAVEPGGFTVAIPWGLGSKRLQKAREGLEVVQSRGGTGEDGDGGEEGGEGERGGGDVGAESEHEHDEGDGETEGEGDMSASVMSADGRTPGTFPKRVDVPAKALARRDSID